jgi:esterase/lipase
VVLKIDRIGRLAGLAAMALLAACAATADLGKRHQPSQLASPLPTGDFDAYVLAARQYIAAANQMADAPLTAAVVEDRGPFELAPRGPGCSTAGPDAKAALLIHDLGDTPYVMRDLGERLARACYLVRAVLLPGHGGVPGDLLTVNYRDWQDAVRLGVDGLSGAAGEVTLVGFGVGGTLALDYALSRKPGNEVDIAALVLLAPAIPTPVSGFEAQTQRIYRALAPLGSGGEWPQVFADSDPVRYESLPTNAGRQMNGLTLELATQEQALDLPVFMAISADDVTVDADAARRWFCSRLAGRRQLIWYASDPGGGPPCDFVEVRVSGPSDEVLNLSHIGLPVDPDNPLYGRTSGYRSCLHYYWEVATPSWFYCSDPAKTADNFDIRYGEISHSNLSEHVVRRLTYNPDFDDLVADMMGFLDGAG